MFTDTREHLAAFLRAVKDDPDDDVPRLVLADWLQEQGDPRGEFIALDMHLHGLFESDPRWQPLWNRRQGLLRRHGIDWVGPFVDVVSGWRFERGFLHLEARAKQVLCPLVYGLAEAGAFDWVEGLTLTNVELRHVDWLSPSPLLAVVPCLSLTQIHLSCQGLQRLLESPHLARLRALDVSRNRLRSWAAFNLARCEALAGLRRLDLSFNPIDDAGALALAASPHLGRLTWLDVRNCEVTIDALVALRLRFGEAVWDGDLG